MGYLMLNLCEYKKLPRQEIFRLAEASSINSAEFVGIDFEGDNGMVLVVHYGNINNSYKGIMYKQDGKPRIFSTPQSIMVNAEKLGIKQYRIDASDWKSDYYKVYDAQVRRAQEKRHQNSTN